MKKNGFSERLSKLPFYMYPEVFAAIEKAKKRGLDIIDFGIGELKFPTPQYIKDALHEAIYDPNSHFYNEIQGHSELRKAISNWYKRRYNIDLDPERQIITFHGSKEGLAYLPLAFINPGDTVLIPDPGYLTYASASAFAGAHIEAFKLYKELGYLPDFSKIEESIASKAKIMYLNYPNNPTGATVEKSFFDQAVDYAQRYDIIICHDAAYREIVYNGYAAPSLLESSNGFENCIEFNTLSKTYSMTGWRIGFAVGDEKIVEGLLNIKRISSNGNFSAVELAGKRALEMPCSELGSNLQELAIRRDFAVARLREMGYSVKKPLGAFYLWIPVDRNDSMAMVTEIISQTGIVFFPGIGFGRNGEGHLRMALVQGIETIERALANLEKYVNAQL